MRKGSVIAILLGMLLAFTLSGCSESEDGESAQPAETIEKATIEGSWVIDGGASVGLAGSLVLDDEGADLVIDGKSFPGTWSVEDGKATLTLEGQSPTAIAYADGKLVVGDEAGTHIVFVRGEVEATPKEPVAEEVPEQPAAESPEPEAPAAEADDEDANADEDEDEPELVDEVIADIAPVVIADDGNCTITVTGRGTDYTADPCYRLTFTNKTKTPLYITAEDDFDVNGTKVGAGIDDIADPGETVVTEIYFPADELGGGLDKLVNVNGTLNVQIDDTYEPVADYRFHMD